MRHLLIWRSGIQGLEGNVKMRYRSGGGVLFRWTSLRLGLIFSRHLLGRRGRMW